MSRRDETFILYYWEDYEQYEAENPSCYYCLSESTVQILLSALRFAGWRTRWRLDRNDHSRRMESNYIWNKIDYMAALAQKELITDMTCDLQAGFDSLADAIRDASPNQGLLALAAAMGRGAGSSSCCADDIVDNQHGGYAGYFTQPETGETWPIFGTEPPLSIPPGEFPEGFESEAEYKLDKCQVANLVVDGAIASLRGLGALGVFNYIAVAGLIVLAITGAIIFPPAFIPIACAAIGVLALEVTVLTLAANEMQTHREELVCMLYNSDSVESALAVVADFVDGLIATLDLTGPKGMAVKQIILLLINGDTLNQLFSKVAHLSYPDADCSACEEPERTLYYPDENGDMQPLPDFEWGQEYTWTAPTNTGNGFRYLQFELYPPGRFDGWEDACIEVTAINAGDTGHCSNSTVPWTTGFYGPESPYEEVVRFNLGCSNTYPMTITFTAYLPGDCPE